nr:retrovirus-related Pol polyprotein from transposon TNT 1-94 [Tanacetum cinerariifolium]
MLDRTDFASWQQRIRLYCQATLAKGTKGAPHLGPKRPRVNSNLSPKEKDSPGNIPRGGGAAGHVRAQHKVRNANPGQARQIKWYNCNGIGHIARNWTQPKCPQNFEYFKDKMLLMQAQENGVALDEEQLLFLV